jgi:hypothetical protein
MGAWRNAHNVLFEYFDNVAEPLPNSLAGLAPLYSAVHHACLSHDYEKGFKIYKERILRDDVQGFSTNRLGAAGEDVACLQGFLETNAQDKEIVQTSLGEENFAWLWARMAFCQTCRGNLDEAVYYRRKQSYYCTEHNNIMGAASASENLSHLHMLRGNLFEAKESADKAIELALNANDWGSEMRGRCRLGAVHYLRENIKDSLEQFDTARKLQQENEPVKPWLAFDYGLYYRFINLDLASGDEEYNDILHDAEGALGPDESWLAPFGMDKLMKGIVMSKLEDLKSAQALFDDAIDTLRESGFVIYLPYYFNFRARFELKRGELFAAGENINEGRSIASEYGLPLMKADIYITDAEIGIADRCAERARVGVEKATRLVTQYGYHYRESELQLLKGQIALLEGRASDCSRILQKIESRIERTGRVRLLKKCRELCQRAEEETKRRAQLRYR